MPLSFLACTLLIFILNLIFGSVIHILAPPLADSRDLYHTDAVLDHIGSGCYVAPSLQNDFYTA